MTKVSLPKSLSLHWQRARNSLASLRKKLTSWQPIAWRGSARRASNWQKTSSAKVMRENSQPRSGWRRLSRPFQYLNKPWVLYLLGCLIVVGLLGVVIILRDLPSPTRITNNDRFAVSTIIYDRNGEVLYEIFADENRIPIKIADLPAHVGQATIAIEDKNFYRHLGFDITGIVRALVNNLRGKPIEGGSTVTQQLVKNALLTNERSLVRKIKEGVLAIAVEFIYSKDEILEMYLNYISYGGTSVGIEAAARNYFDKSAKDLSLAEAALLVGLPQAPSKYSPFGSNPDRAKSRQAEVLRRMVEDGYITPLQAEQAKSEPLEFALSKTEIKAPHFVFYLRDLLYEKYGVETVEKGGLRVHSTLDFELHQAAQASLSAEISQLSRHNISNGAAMVVKPDTGEILSMIGSKDYFDHDVDGNVNVTIAMRQPGSSIKPIMYALAMQNKLLNPGSVLLDIPTCFTIPGQKNYCPKNYDGSFKGPITVRQALGNSLNIPAVKGLRIIGLERFINQARNLGISTWTDPSQYGLSLTLGGGEVRMIDMAQAFGVLANKGVKVPLTPYLKITDYTGKVLEEVDVDQRRQDLEELNAYNENRLHDLVRVMDQAPAYLVSHIMQDNKAREAAFGSRSQLVIPNQIVSAKTGTTNNLKDNWTVGFTPEYLTIVWVGNNDSTPMNPYLVSGVTGAAPIWNDIMSYVLQGKEPSWQEKPSDVSSAQVCATGMPPQSGQTCQTTTTDLYWTEGKPTPSTSTTKEIWIKADTGLPPAYGEQADNLQLHTKTVYSDPLTRAYCADCARAADAEGKPIYEQYEVKFDQPLFDLSDFNQ